jgi:putative transcriptional regulator
MLRTKYHSGYHSLSFCGTYAVIQIRLLELLKARGKTKYWLAKQTNMTPQTVLKLCRGETTRIELATLDLICRALGCEAGDVIVHVPNDKKAHKKRR